MGDLRLAMSVAVHDDIVDHLDNVGVLEGR